jgi:hypothetical protein
VNHMAYLRFEPVRRRLRVSIVAGRKVNGRVVMKRLGSLGTVIADGPTVAERAMFWSALAGRYAIISAKHPERLKRGDQARFETPIALRIPKPTRVEQREAIKQLSRPARGARAATASGRTKMDDNRRGRPLL